MMKNYIFPGLLVLLFVLSYSFRGVLFSTHTNDKHSALQPGIHSKVKKTPISFDMSARTEEE